MASVPQHSLAARHLVPVPVGSTVSPMTQMTSLELVRSTAATIGGLGARYMLHPETAAVGTEAGYENGWA